MSLIGYNVSYKIQNLMVYPTNNEKENVYE